MDPAVTTTPAQRSVAAAVCIVSPAFWRAVQASASASA
jgi:hypothetical protein